MSIFNNLFSKKTTTETAADPFLDALVSLSSSDLNSYVSGSVLQNSDVYAAVSIIAGDLASNPIKSGSDLYDKMINIRPNDQMSGYSFKHALAVEMLLNGNSFAEIDLSSHLLKFIPNNKLGMEINDTDQIIYTYYPNGTENGNQRRIDPSNILHFKCFTRDGLVGLSPLVSLKDEIGIQKSGNQLMRSFFQNGIHGTTLVTAHQTDLSPEAKENIRKKFDEATTGTKALNTIVTDDSMDIKSLPVSSDILKFVNSNDWSTRQIAKAFGLPPERLGVENEHSSQDQSNVSYLQGTLQRYEDSITSELNYKLNQTFTYDNSKLLSLDPQDQQQMAVDGYTSGLYTKNEARAILNLDPVAGGDSFKESEANNGKEINTQS